MGGYASAFYSNSTVRDMVWGLGLHWYSGDSFDNVQQVADAWPGKGLMATEACACPVHLDDWSYGERYTATPVLHAHRLLLGRLTHLLSSPSLRGHFDRYGHDILGDLNVGVQGWTDWNMLLDHNGTPNHVNGSCDAPIIRLPNNTLHLQPSYFYLGHFTRYLPRGATRIMHQFTGSDSPLEISTWMVDVGEGGEESGLKESVRRREREEGVAASGSEVVVIVLNRQASEAELQLTTGYYTPGSLQATVHVPAHSIQTLHFDAALLNTTRTTAERTPSAPSHRRSGREEVEVVAS